MNTSSPRLCPEEIERARRLWRQCTQDLSKTVWAEDWSDRLFATIDALTAENMRLQEGEQNPCPSCGGDPSSFCCEARR